MADITQILNQRMSRYERERARLVEEYVTAAWKMWQSLSPADWWNDAVTQGASAQCIQDTEWKLRSPCLFSRVKVWRNGC